jgi:CheY-like chemotaxis protein
MTLHPDPGPDPASLATVGRLTAAAAHDLNNLLTVVMGFNCELLRGLDCDTPLRAAAVEIDRASQRAAELSRQLLWLSRPRAPGRRGASGSVDLNAVVAEAEQLLKPLMPPHVRWLSLPDASVGSIQGDAGQLSRMVINLVLNARDAMPRGGQLWVATARLAGSQVAHQFGSERSAVPWWVGLTVSDTGCGMDDQTQARLFRAFATTKAEGKGHGLGLTIVQQVVQDHGGLVRVSSKLGSGTTFMVCFPEEPGAADGRPAGSPFSEVSVSQGKETLLLVEDHDAVRSLAAAVLRRHGYAVLDVRGGREALAVSREHPGRVDLLLSDLFLPEIGGLDLAKQLVQARPGLKVLFTSGSLSEAAPPAEDVPPAAFLPKPFRPDDLLAAVRRALDG